MNGCIYRIITSGVLLIKVVIGVLVLLVGEAYGRNLMKAWCYLFVERILREEVVFLERKPLFEIGPYVVIEGDDPKGMRALFDEVRVRTQTRPLLFCTNMRIEERSKLKQVIEKSEAFIEWKKKLQKLVEEVYEVVESLEEKVEVGNVIIFLDKNEIKREFEKVLKQVSFYVDVKLDMRQGGNGDVFILYEKLKKLNELIDVEGFLKEVEQVVKVIRKKEGEVRR